MYIVTGLTKMSNDRVCMSVFDTESQCYRRPMFENRLQITVRTVEYINIFSVIELRPINRIRENLQAPHLEDYIVEYSEQFREVFRLNITQQLDLLNQITYNSTYDLFNYPGNNPTLLNYNNSYYVNPGTGRNSLGTIRAQRVRMYIDGYNSIRLDFTDMAGNQFKGVKFVSLVQIQWQYADVLQIIEAFNRFRPHQRFVRLSLSRPYNPQNGWENPGCFLQVSEVLSY